MTLHKDRNPTMGWLIDSGATRHMTPQRNLFVSYKPSDRVVEFGDRGELPIKGRGEIAMRIGRKTQKMENVLHVPHMSVNLLSIIALDRQGYSVIFENQSVRIIDQSTKGTVARGHVVDGLYELIECDSDRVFATRNGAGRESSDEAIQGYEIMHQRLGHAGKYRLKDLHKHATGFEAFTIPDNHRCEVYDTAKIVRSINREPRTKSTVPGARLHIDVWGKFPVGSIISGCTMYTFLVDEATGKAWILPIKSRTEVGPFVIHNVRWIHSEGVLEGLHPTVSVRTDNAKEYQGIENDLMRMAVGMEFTSTYTAYQNGIAERFNRTVTTIARAMLCQSGLPLSFWAEAIVYACHIYGKLPQGARGSESPDEMWFKKKPDLSEERVFGCVCRAYLAKEQRKTKLSPVNYLGVYTGYHSSTQYRVYRPDKNRFDWPTNVVFYEDRPGIELIPQGLLPKFDWLRADVAPYEPPTVEASEEDTGVSNEAIPSDDDDEDGPEPSGGVATSPPRNDENSEEVENAFPEGDAPQNGHENPGDNPEFGPRGPQNLGNSPAASCGVEAQNEIHESIEVSNSVENRSTQGSPTPMAPTEGAPPQGPRASSRRPIEPTAASSRPQRNRRAPARQEFFETFGTNRNRAHVARRGIEPQTFQEAINGPNSRE